MITIGVDFHKRSSSYTVLDQNGTMIKQCKFENTPERITRFLSQWEGPKQLAMEATYNWGLFYETARPYVDKFLLGHPAKMKAITASETKCDRHDAFMIAQLTAMGFLPKAYIPCHDNRQLRSLVRFRSFLVRQRSAIRNNTQVLIDRNLWPSERPKLFKNIYCRKGRLWLKALPLPDKERFILDELIYVFEQLDEQIKRIESFINQEAFDIPEVEYLRTVPGLRQSKVYLYSILFEIDDIRRFTKARHLARYAGLIPSEHSSGEKQRSGRLIQRSNHALRTSIIEATLSALLADKQLKAYYQSIKARRGSGAAIIACARKLSYAIYYVLKEQRSYRPFPPAAASSPLAVNPL